MIWLVLGLLLTVALRISAWVQTTRSALRQAVTEAYAKRLFHGDAPPKEWIYKRLNEIEKEDKVRYSAYWWICLCTTVIGIILFLSIIYHPFN